MRTYIMTKSILPKVITALVLAAAACCAASAQETFWNTVRFDSTVHDFGAIRYKSGPVRCTFTFENVSDSPVAIYSVGTSCGCTDLDWTREPIRPKGKGTISVTYSNDEGPYPFDKAVTAYISGCEGPVVLRIRGVCTEKEKSLSEIYTGGFGALGMRKTSFSLGNIDRGKTRSDEEYVANTSAKPVRITFTDVTPGLELTVEPNPLPANSTGKLRYSVRSAEGEWGKNVFTAVPLVDGKRASDGKVEVKCFIKEDFTGITPEQKREAPLPMFSTSTFSLGKVRPGTKVEGSFTLRNQGRSDLVIHRIQADHGSVIFGEAGPVRPGGSEEIGFVFDTSGYGPGEEVLVIVTLTTNAPARPMVNLFITGYTE